MYIGEAALIDTSCKRTANVIAADDVTCMTLTKAEFGFLLKGVKGALTKTSETFSVADKKSSGKLKDTVSNVSTSNPTAHKGTIRRVSVLDSKGYRNPAMAKNFLKRLMKFMTESIYLSLYARMYKEMLLSNVKIGEYGEHAAFIMRNDHSYTSSIDAIRKLVMKILSKEYLYRSPMEHYFISGLLRQRNDLKDVLCRGWSVHEYTDL